MHCPLHWLHCPPSRASLVDKHGLRFRILAAGGRDPSPFSIAEARSSRTTVVFWTGDVQQTLMPYASPFSIVNRYLPLHVESSQLQVQLTSILLHLHFHCQPLLPVTYSSYLTQDTSWYSRRVLHLHCGSWTGLTYSSKMNGAAHPADGDAVCKRICIYLLTIE